METITANETQTENDPVTTMLEAARVVDKEHWLASYIHELVEAFKRNGGIDYAAAETLLAQSKQSFERELATARKIYRLYPRLIDESGRSQHVDASAERSGA
jgi:hypothetical protein